MDSLTAAWRVHAQRITTGEWLTRDLPLSVPTTLRSLSGPGGVFGVLNPEQLRLTANDGRPLIEEWTTALYVEEDGELRGGGIVNKVERDGPVKTIDAAGFSAYPVGIPYMDDYRPGGFPDPLDVFRHLWDYVQGFPDGDIGMRVTGTAETWMRLSSGSGPWGITPWENRDVGGTMDDLARTVPFDFVEQHKWADAKHRTVDHTLRVGFPRIGRRRTDLRFADGENIEAFSPIAADGDQYANDVYGFGRGEGRGMLRSRASVRDGRLRRVAVINRKAATQGILDRETQRQLRARRLLLDIREVTVRDHRNARLAALQPGDEILVDLEVPWEGDVRMWLRVLSIQETGDQPGVAVLSTQRADMFTYASDRSPTGEPQVITL